MPLKYIDKKYLWSHLEKGRQNLLIKTTSGFYHFIVYMNKFSNKIFHTTPQTEVWV